MSVNGFGSEINGKDVYGESSSYMLAYVVDARVHRRLRCLDM